MSRDVNEVIKALSIIIEDLSRHRDPDLEEALWEQAVTNAIEHADAQTDVSTILAYWAEVSPDN